MRYIIYFMIYFVMLTGHVAADPAFWRHEWPNTAFSKADVPWIDIQSVGPGKDGIPALSAPQVSRCGKCCRAGT
jgi:hypothetical protein